VEEFFGQCGKIANVRIAMGEDGRPRGFAHIEFDNEDAVQSALKLSGRDLDGRSIRVDVAGNKGGRSGGRSDRGRGGHGFRGGFHGGHRDHGDHGDRDRKQRRYDD
jgi:nucleolin